MKRLEKYKGFPIIAWTLVLVFSLFTLHLTKQVSALESGSSAVKTEAAIEDLDAYFE